MQYSLQERAFIVIEDARTKSPHAVIDSFILRFRGTLLMVIHALDELAKKENLNVAILFTEPDSMQATFCSKFQIVKKVK